MQCTYGDAVDEFGHHGLLCIRSAGRISRDFTKGHHFPGPYNCQIPAVLETDICRNDRKRLDGMTVVPWKLDSHLMWNVTCVNTVAHAHVHSSVDGASNMPTSASATTLCLLRWKHWLPEATFEIPR